MALWLLANCGQAKQVRKHNSTEDVATHVYPATIKAISSENNDPEADTALSPSESSQHEDDYHASDSAWSQ
jgi:hypothetical protein